jgi:myxalamid-type polyketide synthase MxaE and MxaD
MAGFQALSLGLAGTTSDGPTGEFAHLPAGVDAIQLRSSQQSASWIKTELHQSSAGGLLGHISVYADDGTFLAELFDVKLNRVSIHSLRQLWQRDWTEYCYDLDWQEYPVEAAPLDPADPALTGQHWLIFADQAGWASALARRLTSLGATLTLVRPAASFGRDESGCYTLRPDQAEDFRKLADRIETERQGRPLRIVYAWAMDLPPNIQNESELQLAERLTGLAMLHLVQTWLIGPPGMVQALWLHTRGSQVGHLPDQAVAFGQAPLWGMGRGIALEFPEISSGLIDWQPNAELEAEVTAFLTLVKKRPSEDQLVRRDSGWLVPRLRSVRPDLAPSTLPIDPQASYLIPGGLGHIGWQLARWLASQGARHLILTGRRSWDAMLAAQPSKRAEREQERAELGRQGCHIECVQVDLADRKGMTELIASIRQSGHPLRGIIHVAADLQGEPLANMSPAALQGMFRPKVHGTWLLHDITRGLELDFFVLFSSIISLIGSHGLAHYAAANQFIDALAHQRRGLHLPALAVNWGTWQGTSLPIAGGSQKYHDFGFREIPFGQGLLGLGRLIGQKYAQLTVADIDWNILKPAYETKRERPLLTGLAVATAPAAGQMLAQLRALPLEARWKALIEFMKAEVRAVLGHDASRPIDPKAGFFEMGMDSLLGLKFKKRLESELSISLPATIIFSAPDIQALATHLAETGLGVEIRAGSAGAAPEIKAATIPAVAPAAAIEASPGDIEALSDDEVAQSLEQELQRRGY